MPESEHDPELHTRILFRSASACDASHLTAMKPGDAGAVASATNGRVDSILTADPSLRDASQLAPTKPADGGALASPIQCTSCRLAHNPPLRRGFCGIPNSAHDETSCSRRCEMQSTTAREDARRHIGQYGHAGAVVLIVIKLAAELPSR